MKKTLAIVLATLLVFALGANAVAAPKVPDPPPEVGARYAIDFLNVGFHCNANGGNGRVWVSAYDEMYEAAKAAKLKGVLEDFQYLDDNCWLLCDMESYVCPKCGSSVWVSYSNKSGVPDGKNIQLTHGSFPVDEPPVLDNPIFVGGIELEKLVNDDGKIIEITADQAAYIDCFNLYAVDGDKAPLENQIATTKLVDGKFSFSGLADGWYAIEEILKPGGEDIFEQTPVMYFLIANGYTFTGVTVDFDNDAFYTIVNGYGGGYTLGYPGLNNTGDIFPIGVTNTGTGVKYPSFCANAGSRAFAGQSGMGCEGYLIAERINRPTADYSDFVLAYNYIEETIGNLEDNRVITQIVTWILLGAIDIGSTEFENINWNAVTSGTGAVKGVDNAQAKVEDVIAKYKGFCGEEKIVDVVYLVCEHNHPYADCQPQLVPLYGEADYEFVNTLKLGDGPGFDKVFAVSFTKTIYGGVIPVGEGAFEFDLYEIGNEDAVGRYPTVEGGLVTATDLKPGSYVFKEVTKLFWDVPYTGEGTGNGDGGTYNLVWSPDYYVSQFPGDLDGLYFDLTEDGDVIWAEGQDAHVDNVGFCKHNKLWGLCDYYYGSNENVQTPFDGGVLIEFDDWCHGHLVVVQDDKPTCEKSGTLWLKCNGDDCDIGTSLSYGAPLEHDYQPTGTEYFDGHYEAQGAWYKCAKCGGFIVELY